MPVTNTTPAAERRLAHSEALFHGARTDTARVGVRWVRAAWICAAWICAAWICAVPAGARACATCGAGDPTLTVMGAEVPFAGRLRISTQLQYSGGSSGGPHNRADTHEGRAALGVSWSPDPRVTFSAAMVGTLRSVSRANGASAMVIGPGDLEVRSRWTLLRDRTVSPEHLLAVQVGLRSPTSFDQIDERGRLLPLDAQTGTGAFEAIGGASYTHLADPWSLFVSAAVHLPFAGRYRATPGPALYGTVAAQYRLDRHFTVRGGVDVRLDAPWRLGARTDPTTDGFTGFVSPDVLWSPEADWVFVLGVRVPVLQVYERPRQEAWSVHVSAVVDL